ncbi:MAG: PEGA domain-containing protein [Bergeyella sp.]|nr:PEGA domain-containing protein [Bergeyella sp.]
MKNFVTRFGVCIISIISLVSCATIFTGTTDDITITTKPAGATVYMKGLEKCTTPCTFIAHRSLNETTIDIRKDGYDPRTIGLDRKFNPVSIINLGSIIGWGVDAATGSIMKYDTKGYNIELKQKKEKE